MSVARTEFQRESDRRGVTVVEFALTLPILITLVIGMIEFTRLHNLRHAADNAAYEAARHVVVPGASKAEAEAEALDLLARAGVANASITVTPSVIGENTENITVTVSVPLTTNSWLPAGLTRDRTVLRECTLMTERVPVIQATGLPVPAPEPTPTPPPTPEPDPTPDPEPTPKPAPTPDPDDDDDDDDASPPPAEPASMSEPDPQPPPPPPPVI